MFKASVVLLVAFICCTGYGADDAKSEAEIAKDQAAVLQKLEKAIDVAEGRILKGFEDPSKVVYVDGNKKPYTEKFLGDSRNGGNFVPRKIVNASGAIIDESWEIWIMRCAMERMVSNKMKKKLQAENK